MNDDLIARIDALAEKATKGPWTVQFFEGEKECGHPVECDYEHLATPQHALVVLDYYETPESKFAIALVNAFPALLAEIEALRELEKAVAGVVTIGAESMFGDDTDNPECCDPYIVERKAFRAMREQLNRARAGRLT